MRLAALRTVVEEHFSGCMHTQIQGPLSCDTGHEIHDYSVKHVVLCASYPAKGGALLVEANLLFDMPVIILE